MGGELLTFHLNLVPLVPEPLEVLDAQIPVVHHLKRVTRLGLALLSVASLGEVVCERTFAVRLVESVDGAHLVPRDEVRDAASLLTSIDLDAQVRRGRRTAVDCRGTIVTVAEDGVDVIYGVALNGVKMKVCISQDAKAWEDIPILLILGVPDVPKRRDIHPLRRRPQPVIQKRRQQEGHIMAIGIQQRRELPFLPLLLHGSLVCPVADPVHHEGVHEARKLAHLRVAAANHGRVGGWIATEGAVAADAAGAGRVDG